MRNRFDAATLDAAREAIDTALCEIDLRTAIRSRANVEPESVSYDFGTATFEESKGWLFIGAVNSDEIQAFSLPANMAAEQVADELATARAYFEAKQTVKNETPTWDNGVNVLVIALACDLIN